jgi:hypothetical protein
MNRTGRRWDKPQLHPAWYCPCCQCEWGDKTDHEIAERVCEPCMAPRLSQRHTANDVLIPGHGYITREEARALANPTGTETPEVPKEEGPPNEEDEDGGLADA